MTKPIPRRMRAMKEIDPPEKHSGVPAELPVDAKADAKSVEQQIQEQIAIAIAKKNSPPGP